MIVRQDSQSWHTDRQTWQSDMQMWQSDMTSRESWPTDRRDHQTWVMQPGRHLQTETQIKIMMWHFAKWSWNIVHRVCVTARDVLVTIKHFHLIHLYTLTVHVTATPHSHPLTFKEQSFMSLMWPSSLQTPLVWSIYPARENITTDRCDELFLTLIR